MTVKSPAGYEIVRPIGRGSASAVWEAVQLSTRRRVALKMLDIDLADPAVRSRFETERAALGALAVHPHVVTVYDTGILDNRPWIATELCRRRSLGAYIAVHGPLDLRAGLAALISLATALDVAHRTGTLHGALAASNILVTDRGDVVIDDLGINRPSLDRALDDRPTSQQDIHDLGSLLQHACGGPAALPRPLAELLQAMTALAPGDRQHSAAAIAERARALQHALGLPHTDPPVPVLGAQDEPHPPRPTERTQWWARGARMQAEPAVEALAEPVPGRRTGRARTIIAICAGVLVAVGAGTVAVGMLTPPTLAASTPASVGPQITAEPTETRPPRSPIRVYNNTDIDGLAAAAASKLEAAGWTVEEVGDYITRSIQTSTVFYRPGTNEEVEAHQLASEFDLRTHPRSEALREASPGIIVILVTALHARDT